MSKYFRVALPWPDWDLSPNSRKGWRAKAALTKVARQDAMFLAMAENAPIDGDVLYAIWIFHEPDNSRRDLGNMLSACKAFQDGVFDALGMDDKIIRAEYSYRSKPMPWGGVILRLYDSRDEFMDGIRAFLAIS